MKIDKAKKKEILLSSFELLKDNWSENSRKLNEIVVKIGAIDKDTAVELWKFLLTKHKNCLKDNSDYGARILTTSIYSELAEKIGSIVAEEIVLNNEIIKLAIFKECIDACFAQKDIILRQLIGNNLALVNELLELVYSNKKSESPFGEFMLDIIESLECEYDSNKKRINEEGFNLLTEWVSKIKDSQQKAKISVSLLGLLEEED